MTPSRNTDLYNRAAIIPGRSCTRSKAPDRLIRAYADEPRSWMRRSVEWLRTHVLRQPYRATEFDSDGRELIDMVGALGARSLGHDRVPPKAYGVSSLADRAEVEVGEMVREHIAPWASKVRFLKTGSEATHAAYMIAKRATGKDLVFVGDWAYHGWHEWCAARDSAGQPVSYTHGFDLNNLVRPWAVAAVFVEPHRWEPVDVEWLKSVRAFCDRVGALLVFDSMIYGGRWAMGGASEYFEVTPDLECFGKAYGNGQAVAFVVGNRALAEHGELASGTYSGDVTGLEAVRRTLTVYRKKHVVDVLWERGRRLQAGLKSVVPPELATVEGAPVHLRIRFNEPTPPTGGAYDYRTVGRPMATAFRQAMADRGVLCLPDAINVMYAHTASQIDQVVEAVEQSTRTLHV